MITALSGVTILDQNEKQICREEIDTYAEKRIEGAELIQKDFPEGSYTIQFERVGKKSKRITGKRGWVEVGTLKIRTEKERNRRPKPIGRRTDDLRRAE